MIVDALFPLLSSGQSIFNTDSWRRYLKACTSFIMADSDSTNGSNKINTARASGELKSLSSTAIEAAGVAAFLVVRESVSPIARLHGVILHRTSSAVVSLMLGRVTWLRMLCSRLGSGVAPSSVGHLIYLRRMP
jgi:hypothetical protein